MNPQVLMLMYAVEALNISDAAKFHILKKQLELLQDNKNPDQARAVTGQLIKDGHYDKYNIAYGQAQMLSFGTYLLSDVRSANIPKLEEDGSGSVGMHKVAHAADIEDWKNYVSGNKNVSTTTVESGEEIKNKESKEPEKQQVDGAVGEPEPLKEPVVPQNTGTINLAEKPSVYDSEKTDMLKEDAVVSSGLPVPDGDIEIAKQAIDAGEKLPDAALTEEKTDDLKNTEGRESQNTSLPKMV